jgi:hypothetical protein
MVLCGVELQRSQRCGHREAQRHTPRLLGEFLAPNDILFLVVDNLERGAV